MTVQRDPILVSWDRAGTDRLHCGGGGRPPRDGDRDRDAGKDGVSLSLERRMSLMWTGKGDGK